MARECKQTGLASSCSTPHLIATNWAHKSSLYFQHCTNSKERAGNGTKMATCQSHYMKNGRGEKHTMTLGNSTHSPPEHTGRVGERSLLRTKTATWTRDGNPDTPLSLHFQKKMSGYPSTHRTTPAPVPFHATPILRAPSRVAGECMEWTSSPRSLLVQAPC